MSTKIVQFTQQQVDLFQNDIIEVLQEISKVSTQLQEQNIEVTNIFDNESKNEKLITDIDFLINSVGMIKNEFVGELKDVKNLYSRIDEHIERINTINRKLDKKYSNFQVPSTKSKSNKYLLILTGIMLGIFLNTSIFIYAHDDFSIVSNTYNKALTKTKDYYEEF